MGEEKAKFNLNQPLPLTKQDITMCIKICSLLPSKGCMFEESSFIIDVLAFASHKEDYFEEIVVEPLAIIKGDYEFFPLFKLLKRKCCPMSLARLKWKH